MKGATLVLLSVLVFAPPAAACEVEPLDTVQFATITDPVTIELSDGRTLRLEGLGGPRAPSRHDGPWPMLDEATAEVRALVGDGPLLIAPTDEPDRYGRIIAQAWLESGTWLNGALAARGLARVETTLDQRRCASDALLQEAEARFAQPGMWQLSAYELRNAMETSAFTNDFQIIEGRISAAEEVRGRIYLNFGTDWRDDFTVTIAPRDVRRFAESGVDPLSWADREIRVRGWLEFYNGPMIEATHPEQIELLGGAMEGISDE